MQWILSDTCLETRDHIWQAEFWKRLLVARPLLSQTPLHAGLRRDFADGFKISGQLSSFKEMMLDDLDVLSLIT